MGISWYKVTILKTRRPRYWANTIHPPCHKISRFPGRFPRRYAPRNDMEGVGAWAKGRYPFETGRLRRGARRPPYEHVVPWYHSTGLRLQILTHIINTV